IDASRQMEHRSDDLEIEEIVGVELCECLEGIADMPLCVFVEVVEDDKAAVVFHPTHELFELEADEATIDAELDDVALDLLGDASHHLRSLEHGDDIAQRDEVFDLERRQRAGHAVEATLVPLERGERLVRLVEQ